MRETVRCAHCGALYEREEHLTVVRWRDPFNCLVCGHEMESWSRSRRAIFRLIRGPTPPPTSEQPR